MEEYAIIVAGGSGSRMKSDIPKQFIAVQGLPVLMHTIRAFRKYSVDLQIILVLPEAHFSFWNELCSKYHFEERYTLVAGGETRFHSVKNGLEGIASDSGLVAVHDGVRPVIFEHIIKNSFSEAALHGSAVVSVPLKDSIRIVEQGNANKALDRSNFRLIQTPQTFPVTTMKKAFDTPYQPHFTDCASVMEASGHAIHLIDGAYENIKITTPEDLIWADIFLRDENQ